MTAAQRTSRTLLVPSRDTRRPTTIATVPLARPASHQRTIRPLDRVQVEYPQAASYSDVRHGDRTPAATPPTGLTTSTGVLFSEKLLQGAKVVQIQHNGETYQLRATRHGKLILTK
jgi:hemin uptake protein HemP